MAMWTKRNVTRMTTDNLIYWYNKSLELIKEGERLNVEVPASQKAYALVSNELKKREVIR